MSVKKYQKVPMENPSARGKKPTIKIRFLDPKKIKNWMRENQKVAMKNLAKTFNDLFFQEFLYYYTSIFWCYTAGIVLTIKNYERENKNLCV